jgi:multidrug efflux pump subunit AcrB
VNQIQSEKGFHASAVRRPVGLLVAFITLMVIGGIAYSRIPLQMLPNGLSGSRLTVFVRHPGSSAQENEEKVARVIEEQFRTLPDLEDVWSRSGPDDVRISVRFNQTDMDLAKAELRDRIERARPLMPTTVDRISVWASDDGDLPVMWFAALGADQSPNTNYLIENVVQRRLEGADGVSRVQMWGILDEGIKILLDENKVRAARLDIGNLVRRLSTDNFTQPLGEVTDGEQLFLLRADMRFETLEEVEDYPIGDGLRLRDVARIERVRAVRDRLSRIDGRFAYYGMVQKESTANVVEVSKNLKRVIADLETDPQLGGQFSINPLFNQGDFIEDSLGKLRNTAMWGGGLAVIILFVFLRRVRMTLCVALSIPVSALLAIAYENFTGGTFNVLTMTGLTLGIGMLVDNSVVVIESIARKRSEGLDAHRASVEGVRDVGLAVALGTMTSVVVFLPLIFMGQNPSLRVMLTALGIPLSASLIFSLFVALVFLPVASARIIGDRHPFADSVAGILDPIVGVPVRGLAHVFGALRAAWQLVLVIVHYVSSYLIRVLTPVRWVLALLILVLFGWRLGSVFPNLELAGRLSARGVPSESPLTAAVSVLGGGFFYVILGVMLVVFGLPRWRKRPRRAPPRPQSYVPEGNSVLTWMQNTNGKLLHWTLQHRLLALVFCFAALTSATYPVSNMTIAGFGQDEDLSELEIDIDLENNFTLAEASAEINKYEVFLEDYRERLGFKNLIARFGAGGGEVSMRWEERLSPDQLTEYRELLREEVPHFAGHEMRFAGQQQEGASNKQFVSYQLRGPEADKLEKFGLEAVEILKNLPGLQDVSTSLEDAPEQVRLVFDEEAAYRYGVTAESALQNVSWALRGAQLPRYQEEGREIPFFIEYDEERLAGLDTLRNLDVWTGESSVPLTSFAEIEFHKGRRRIYRWNGKTTFTIHARVVDPNRKGELVIEGYDALERGLTMPRGFELGRDTSFIVTQDEEMSALQSALVLGIVLVFLLMGILFESLLLPFSVLMTIPFAYMGSMWTLYLSNTVMDSVGYIGIIILVGVVVNNGIVLIDKIHRMRLEGMDRHDAVLSGASARVRPILMTALTTVFGLLPMALGEASREGIDYRALATCVAGGLAVSTFFTLWVVPLAYTLMEDLGDRLGWLSKRTVTRGSIRRRK